MNCIKDAPENFFIPSAMWGYSKKMANFESGMASYEPGIRLSPDTESAGVLILDFSASRTLWEISICCLNHQSGISVRAVWMDEDVHIADLVLTTVQDIKNVRGWDSALPPRSLSRPPLSRVVATSLWWLSSTWNVHMEMCCKCKIHSSWQSFVGKEVPIKYLINYCFILATCWNHIIFDILG